MRRYESTYKVERRDNLGEEKFWNDRFQDIDLRIHATEEALSNLDEVANRVESLALDRINNVITPLVVETRERIASIPNLFTATSTSTNSVAIGTKTFFVDVSMRLTFAVSGYMIASRIADPAVWVSGTLVSYDADTGELVLEVDEKSGTGTFSDWRFRPLGRRGLVGETGPRGIDFKGAYSGVATYVARDAVRDQGSLWINKRGSVGVAPPALPTTSSADWELVVLRGLDGADGISPTLPTITPYAEGLLNDADDTAARTTLGLGAAAVKGIATANDFRSKTNTDVLTTDKVYDANVWVDLGNQTGSITIDASTGFNFKMVATGNLTINVSNLPSGKTIGVAVYQDATGSRTVSWNSKIKFPQATPPAVGTAANANACMASLKGTWDANIVSAVGWRH